MTELLAAALRYAKHDWPVFPAHTSHEGRCSCGKADCHNVGKHPRTRNGLSDASTDREQIERWWGMWPDANVAVATGRSAGIFVLDADPRHGGDDALHELQREHEELPATASVKTPSGGEHFCFRYPSVEVRNSEGKVAAGLDVRGEGGYVLLPPSLGATGRRYEVDERTRPVEAPSWLLELIRDATERRNGHAPPVGEEIPDGQRNATLASLAGSMRRRGMDAAAILAALRETNRLRCKPPLDDPEVEAIANSVSRYAPASGSSPRSYEATIDEKGNMKLPAVPGVEDVAGHCAWLTGAFALDTSHPITGGRREGLRGPEGHVVLYRAAAEPIRFEPAARINAPMRLIETLSWQTLPSDGALLPYKAIHCQRIAHVIRMLCGVSERVTEEQEAEGIIGTFLQSAAAIEGVTTYGAAAERYAAAIALRRPVDEVTGREMGQARYLIDANTGELVIGVGELARAARWHIGSSLPRGWLDARMDALAWRRVKLDGHESPGRSQGRHARIDAYRGHLSQGGEESQ